MVPSEENEGSLTMSDIIQEILAAKERIERVRPTKPRELFYPAYLVKQAAELFKDRDWYINGYDGSRYYHGELVKEPSLKVNVVPLNEKFVAMELPDCLQRLSPAEREVHLLGRWHYEEEKTP